MHMANKTKEFITVVISMILITALSYTAIYLYRYYIYYDGFQQIPAHVYVDFLIRVFPAFFGIFAVITILLVTKSGNDTEHPFQAVTSSELQNIYSLDIQIDETDEQHASCPAPNPPSEQITIHQQANPETIPQKRSAEHDTAESVDPAFQEESSLIFAKDLTPEEKDFLTPETPYTEAAEPSVAAASSLKDDPVKNDVSSGESVKPAYESVQEMGFHERFKQEVEFSNEKKYEISLVILNIEPQKYSSDFLVFQGLIHDFFKESAFIFPYSKKNTFAIVLPFYSFQDTQNELLSLFESIRDELNHRSTSFRVGFTSKFNRYIDSETMIYETEIAFKKSLEEEVFCILGFEPDINKYEQYYSS